METLRTRWRGSLSCVLLLLTTVGARSSVVDDTVATVNGEAVLLSDFQNEYATALRQSGLKDDQGLKKETLDRMIDRLVLSQAAAQQGIKVLDREVDEAVARIESGFTTDENGKTLTEEEAQRAFQDELKAEGVDFPRFQERIRKELAGRKLIEREVQPRVRAPARKEVRAYFDRLAAYAASGSTQPPSGMESDDAAQFLQIAAQIRHLTAERVRVSNILVAIAPDASEKEIDRARAKAEAIRAEILQRGASSFADVARAESEDAETAADGGDLGVIARGEAAPGFEKAIFALPLGEVSPPILTGAGYRLALVQGKSVAEPPRLERFEAKLSQILAQSAYRTEARRYVEELRRKAEIIVQK